MAPSYGLVLTCSILFPLGSYMLPDVTSTEIRLFRLQEFLGCIHKILHENFFSAYSKPMPFLHCSCFRNNVHVLNNYHVHSSIWCCWTLPFIMDPDVRLWRRADQYFCRNKRSKELKSGPHTNGKSLRRRRLS